MHKRLSRILLPVTSVVVAAGVLLAGCTNNQSSGSAPGASPAQVSSPTSAGSSKPFQWPDTMHFAATGSSGEAKMVSWASVMQSDLKGPIIRVVNEAAWTNTHKDMANNQMVVSQIDKATLGDAFQAINEYATPDGGPWPMGVVWVDSLASSGFMVRGDSDIRKPEDIKPGTKIAIWNNNPATLTTFLSLLAWGNVNEKDIVWVNTGDYNAGPRAVTSGRADITMAAPVTPAVIEAAAAPGGVRYISLDPKDNPEGAKRFLQINPLYEFGPITVGPKSAQGTWAVASYKYVGANLNTDAELIYNMVKWLDQNYDKYKDRYESNKDMTYDQVLASIQTTFAPLHPGLIKYLKEKGVWSQDHERRNQKNLATLQRYIDGYKEAMKQASAGNIEIKSNNPKWIEFWENYKLTNKIPIIQMHVSLTQDAPEKLPSAALPGKQESPGLGASPTPSPATTAPTATDVPIEVRSISDAHPGDDITVTVKTAPGTEVTIEFTMPNGTKSAYPSDNTKTAGSDGMVTWSWNINSRVPAGEATITLTAKLAGKQSVLTVKKTI